jgi:hypothetical protein
MVVETVEESTSIIGVEGSERQGRQVYGRQGEAAPSNAQKYPLAIEDRNNRQI